MNRLLVGIAGPRNPATKLITHTISQELNLININIRQPFLNVLSAVTQLTPHQAAALPGTHKIDELKCNVAAFERSFLSATYELNRDYFIDVAELTLARSTAGFTETMKDLFSGHIISGITRAQEAEFVRKRGGLIVHVQWSEGSVEVAGLKPEPNDIVIDAIKFKPADRNDVKALISQIKQENKRAA